MRIYQERMREINFIEMLLSLRQRDDGWEENKEGGAGIRAQ